MNIILQSTQGFQLMWEIEYEKNVICKKILVCVIGQWIVFFLFAHVARIFLDVFQITITRRSRGVERE